ncbi:endopeptidase [Bordetella hinzii]|uniref:Bbp19 family protein n=1 Tax=Bordetella hinzii TaxID=103855 RepID=UPI0013EFEC67|nr:endopeptidase [Bordetella hinzii]QII84180.1 endopeptidase [Bordetella hinzii]
MTSGHDPLDLLGQERTEAEKAEEERLAREREKSDLCVVMGSKEGRRVVWRLLEQAGIHRISFVPGDPLATAFNEGQRNLGLKLQADVEAASQKRFIDMMREAQEQKERDEQRNADRRNRSAE